MKAQRWTRRLRAQRRQGRRAVVWFGNGGSTYTGGIRDIAKIRAALEAVNREIPLSLSVVSNRRDVYREVDRKSVASGKSVSVRVDPGGRRIIKKKKYDEQNQGAPDISQKHKKNS